MTLTNWRFFGHVQITTSLLVQFVIRGATLSIVVAVVLESAGQRFLGNRGETESLTGTWSFGAAAMMLVVGFSEEFAKMIAATCGTCLTIAALREQRGGCCFCQKHFCHVLLGSRRELALAGLAAGFGFMTIENMEYVLVTVRAPSERSEPIVRRSEN